jgi:predicted O-methyltransferase YrrM
MNFSEVYESIKDVPFIRKASAKQLYNFIINTKPMECLELGFAHGSSSCYIAAALQENGFGTLTTIDLLSSVNRNPSIEDLLKITGLAENINIHREQNSYTWFLKKKIVERTLNNQCIPIFDFCYIDGCKNWTIDGLAFFLVDKLLKPGGWILFDDYQWTYKRANTRRGATDGITHRSLSIDQQSEPNIQCIFEYLVKQHPSYHNFHIDRNDWAWAQKK